MKSGIQKDNFEIGYHLTSKMTSNHKKRLNTILKILNVCYN